MPPCDYGGIMVRFWLRVKQKIKDVKATH